jgi:hypothetical protein
MKGFKTSIYPHFSRNDPSKDKNIIVWNLKFIISLWIKEELTQQWKDSTIVPIYIKVIQMKEELFKEIHLH